MQMSRGRGRPRVSVPGFVTFTELSEMYDRTLPTIGRRVRITHTPFVILTGTNVRAVATQHAHRISNEAMKQRGITEEEEMKDDVQEAS